MEAIKIIGVWRLYSCEYKSKDGVCFFPYGKEPKGLLIYDQSGYMSGMMAKSERPNLSTEDFSKISESEKVSLSDGYIGYSGKYKITGDKIIHHVENSFIPNWIGKPLDRFYELHENRLILKTPPTNFNGKEFVGYVTWEKI